MKIRRTIRIMLLMGLFISMFFGCANNPNTIPRDLSAASGELSVDHWQSEATTTENSDSSSVPVQKVLDIEYGKIYTKKDSKQIHQLLEQANNEMLQSGNEHFSDSVSDGTIPKAISVEYNGANYELSLNCEGYNMNASGLILKYLDAEHKIGLDLDADTMGRKYYYMGTSAFSSTFPVAGIEKKTEEELIEIAEAILAPHMREMQIKEEDYWVLSGWLENREHSHVDLSCKLFRVEYLYNNEHAKNDFIAGVNIDEYGFVTQLNITTMSILDDDFLAVLPEIDYGKITQDIEAFREPKCDCSLHIGTRLIRREYEGNVFAELVISIFPDKDGEAAGHVHDYINNPLYIFYELNP